MNYLTMINLGHMLALGPLFLYVAYKKNTNNIYMYYLLLLLGIYAIYKHSTEIKTYGFSFVSIVHILLVGPLLVYIGWLKTNTPNGAYELLLMSGFAVIAYHGIQLLGYNPFK